MRRFMILLAFFSMPFMAMAAAPTTQSIETLFALTNVEKVVDGMKPQIYASIKTELDKSLAGRSVSADEQKAVDNYLSRSEKIMNEFLKFDRLKPLYLKLYSETFTQDEVDGLIAFYKTSSGKALITKMPKLMQTLMAVMPEVISPMSVQIQQAANQFKIELEAARKNATK